MPLGVQIQAPINLLQPRMQASDDELWSDAGGRWYVKNDTRADAISHLSDDELWSSPDGKWVAARWNATLSESRISQQTFPPTIIPGMEARKLLYNWADLLKGPLRHRHKTPEMSLSKKLGKGMQARELLNNWTDSFMDS